MNELLIFLGTALCLSCSFGIIMIWYVRSSLLKTREEINIIYTASEEMVEIFSMIDAYKEHLNSVYEMPTFYGDNTLQSLLDHTNQMIEFMKKYDKVYSFTQPDLEEQLSAAQNDMEEEEYEEEEAKE